MSDAARMLLRLCCDSLITLGCMFALAQDSWLDAPLQRKELVKLLRVHGVSRSNLDNLDYHDL
jgi:hypothetical protein